MKIILIIYGGIHALFILGVIVKYCMFTRKWNNKTEEELCQIATYSNDDSEAQIAMDQLRARFDHTYHWNLEYDGLVMKDSDLDISDVGDMDSHVF